MVTKSMWRDLKSLSRIFDLCATNCKFTVCMRLWRANEWKREPVSAQVTWLFHLIYSFSNASVSQQSQHAPIPLYRERFTCHRHRTNQNWRMKKKWTNRINRYKGITKFVRACVGNTRTAHSSTMSPVNAKMASIPITQIPYVRSFWHPKKRKMTTALTHPQTLTSHIPNLDIPIQASFPLSSVASREKLASALGATFHASNQKCTSP